MKNDLLSSWRNLKKNRLYAALNIIGLAVGIAVTLFAVLMIRFEASYDRQSAHASRIFRVAGPRHSGTPFFFGGRLLSLFPEVEDVVALKKISTGDDRVLVTAGEKRLREEKLFVAEPSFFRLFPVSFIAGRPETALSHPHAATLTESAARRYFGTTDCLGLVVAVEGRHELQVEAVVRDLPPNSHFSFNVLAPVEAGPAILGHDDREIWSSWNYKTYVLVAEGAAAESLEGKLPRAFPEEFRASRAGGVVDPSGLRLQPLTDIHLWSHLRDEIEPNRDIRSILLVSAVVLLILLSSVLNFVSLATAQSLRRFREVGLRKVLGAARGQIVRQFLGEALLLSAASSVAALVLLRWMFPLLREFSGTALAWGDIPWLSTAGALFALNVLVGTAAGAFPAFFAASFSPARSLKVDRPSAKGKMTSRHALLLFQFLISLVFLTGALIIRAQLRHLQTRDLGIDGDQVVIVRLPSSLMTRTESLKAELLGRPGIRAASGTSFVPGRSVSYLDSAWEGLPPGEKAMLHMFVADPDVVETYGLTVIEGRDFLPEDATAGERRLLVNEAAVRRFGWDRAVDKRMEFSTPFGKACRVVGVVRDFNFRSLYFPREPLVIMAMPPSFSSVVNGRPWNARMFGYLAVKLSGQDLPAALRVIREFCRTHIAEGEGVWSFLNDEFGRVYAGEMRLAKMMDASSVLAVLLSVLGVFGISAFLVERRRKEISIRKVLGASPVRIVALCSRDFLRLQALAAVVTVPVVLVFARRWLDTFAYRIALGPACFILGFALTCGVLLAVIAWHVLRAALANPAANLRQD